MTSNWLPLAAEALPWVVVAWAVHRARYMSHATSMLDRLSIVAIGGGALGFALAPLLGSWATWTEPLLWLGIIGWCVVPTLRRDYTRTGGASS